MKLKKRNIQTFRNKDEELLFYKRILKSINASIYVEGIDPYAVDWVSDNDILDRVLGMSSQQVMKDGSFASALIDNEQDFYEAITLSTEALKLNQQARWVGVCRMKHTNNTSSWILFSTSNFEADDQGHSTRSVTVAISLVDLFKSKNTLIDCIEDLKRSVYKDEYESLTKRQLQVLKMIGEGRSNVEMAAQLDISRHTVIDHRKAIYKKLNCKNERELLITASKKGMI